jgi:hypothetical protein
MIAMGDNVQEFMVNGRPNKALVHDKVVSISINPQNPFASTVTLALTTGFSFAKPVLYLSTESSQETPAALEGATLAPGLQDIDLGNDDSAFSAVERIFITINGPRGCDNPQRQGIESALIDGRGPLNVLGGIPTVATDYSPLWDANVGVWTELAIQKGWRSRVIDEFQILSLVEAGAITGPGGAKYGDLPGIPATGRPVKVPGIWMQRIADGKIVESWQVWDTLLMLQQPNFLLLDEPTNNLDIASVEVLEGVLDEFEGTVLTISHDRYFLDNVVDRVIELKNGTLRQYAGGYTDYVEAATRGIPPKR